ncbi:MAG TPA: hypothetical protein VMJ35_01920 [Dongiaceae bacterium]|nr:hypothetical protein [Dongiaceae bacterium]
MKSHPYWDKGILADRLAKIACTKGQALPGRQRSLLTTLYGIWRITDYQYLIAAISYLARTGGTLGGQFPIKEGNLQPTSTQSAGVLR